MSSLIKKFINDLVKTDELTNIILYSENTTGKTQISHYIASYYYKNLFENHNLELEQFKSFKSFEDNEKDKFCDEAILKKAYAVPEAMKLVALL